jgi:transaldolase
MRKAGAKDYSLYTKSILKITKKPVSCEVFADDINNMIKQGKEIRSWGKNLYVKVPITNSKGKYMSKVIRNLNNNNIKLNITAVYTSMQTRQILRNINKKTKVIISIFAGRMADSGIDPIPIFKDSIKFASKFRNVQILWASTREAYNYLQAKKLNCHIITAPPKIIEKIENFSKNPRKLTTNTVKGFLQDSKKSKFKIL